MNGKIKVALTFDDVLLVPKKTEVASRREITLSTNLTRNIKLNIPLVSANMDTVTESEMAIALAREGGIGIIHRFMSVEDQVLEVRKVKRSESFIVEDPYTLTKDKTVGFAREFMKQKSVGGLLIVDVNNKLEGILSRRDILFADDELLVSQVMTKNSHIISVQKKISFEEARKILHEHRIEKLPIVNKNNEVKGLITSKDLRKFEKHPLALKDDKGRLMVGAAVGVKTEDFERANELVKAGTDVLVLDIAHGHSKQAIKVIKELKKKFPKIDLIAGNVATAQGTKDLIVAGADAVKVGVGPGSICITRIVAGTGVPQLSAIINCSKEAKRLGVPIIADGGVKNSGDLTKALAAGASSVMCGNLFAGTDEAPGITQLRNGTKYKVTRGMASFGATLGRTARENGTIKDDDFSDVVPEGVEAMVPYKGKAQDVIKQLTGGLRSGISYCGARNIKEMQKNAEFIRITAAGVRESKPHDVELV
ncbi:MAG: IMP dehydrogenase [Nanoarchaeota archaeon]|nr:IMP dehydrogenase [Nanoarchaeota archaeon]MBU1270400.1 IMP dehydrogenase [Nanoarchaeota archaeon]MBU1604831.1 IMP dehydrogenase [Nanoarchaeota archaeon]MBU2442814.1 IMP dehydrogenase [Nanoarchaeota archaeon]